MYPSNLGPINLPFNNDAREFHCIKIVIEDISDLTIPRVSCIALGKAGDVATELLQRLHDEFSVAVRSKQRTSAKFSLNGQRWKHERVRLLYTRL